ncbi:MAG TPA: hypothetical protein VEW45_00370 [Candidatus Dormibacteraeota bacterium]|nr:hypothetical protein [Candidatus Dormibacteraeota bacterium]
MSARFVSAAAARRSGLTAIATALTLVASLLPTALAAPDAGTGGSSGGPFAQPAPAAVGHLLLSELVTGGASASDEFVEIYNPAPVGLPTEGLELIYVSASGATITRKAAWPAGAAEVPPGGHLLIANEAGPYSTIADLTYANGLAATGGSLALRVLGATTAVDAVGWGSAANIWLESAPAAAPAAGRSLERLPGGVAGSSQDTDQNQVDFVEREAPDPQNSGSPSVPSSTPQPSPSGDPTPAPTIAPTPAATPTPTAVASPTATASSAQPTPTPAPLVVSVVEARTQPDGSLATTEAVSLTDGTFADGGGYVADDTGGIALLVSDGSFPRGVLLRATGTLDDRFHQRTLRAVVADVTVLATAPDPIPVPATTGTIGEALEGRLVVITGLVASGATALSGGLAFDLDDGSGSTRVVVSSASGVDTGAWERGATITLWGVVGQRDSTGSGVAGYRVQPRDKEDIRLVVPPPASSPTPDPSSPGASPSAYPSPRLVSVASARQAASGERVRVRGVVTLPLGLTEPGSAAIQDASGGILIRLGDDAGSLARGEMVELSGTRSTKAGMLSLRVTAQPVRLGHQAEPSSRRVATGRLGEDQEALLVVTRGALTGKVQSTSAGNRYFEIDDGSGPMRIFLSTRAAVTSAGLVPGAWVEVAGVLGQETTGQQPSRGYRIWPRVAADVRVLAQPVANDGGASRGSGTPVGDRFGASGGSLAAGVDRVDLPAPQLTRAVPTASAPTIVIGEATATRAPVDDGPAAGGAALLVAGLMLLAAGWLVLPPGWRSRLQVASGRAQPNQVTDDPPPAWARSSPAPDPAMRLVPLTVLDGTGADASRPSTSPSDRGRILPPT